jgi:hypothetical protein
MKYLVVSLAEFRSQGDLQEMSNHLTLGESHLPRAVAVKWEYEFSWFQLVAL